MKNLPLLIGTVLGTVILIVGVAMVFSNQAEQSPENASFDIAQIQGDQRLVFSAMTPSAETQEAQTSTAMETSEVMEAESETADETVPSEKVVITEFSDFQCPACQATAPVLKAVVAQYPDQVVINYRHFPLISIHPLAQLAAQASEVAADEGKFWEYHDVLFANQTEWSSLSQAQARDTFAEYASQLGIDSDSFNERIQSDSVKDRVLDDLKTAQALNLPGTPSVFVQDRLISAPSQATLLDAVESALESM